jgi:hypothetical protein
MVRLQDEEWLLEPRSLRRRIDIDGLGWLGPCSSASHIEVVEQSERFVRIPTTMDWAPEHEWAAVFATRPSDWAWRTGRR